MWNGFLLLSFACRDDNPLVRPPLEVCEGGVVAIANYFTEERRRREAAAQPSWRQGAGLFLMRTNVGWGTLRVAGGMAMTSAFFAGLVGLTESLSSANGIGPRVRVLLEQ